MRRVALCAALLLPAVALWAAPRTGYTACRARGPRQAHAVEAPVAAPAAPAATTTPPETAPAGQGEEVDRAELLSAIARFEEEAKAYRAAVQGEIREAYDRRHAALD